MIEAVSPVESVIADLEKLIEALRENRIRVVSINKMNTIERVHTVIGEVAYIKVVTTDISFSGEVK